MPTGTPLSAWKYIKESFAEHTLHFIGLLSDGGVHSRINQLLGFVHGAAKDGAKRIRVHILTVRARKKLRLCQWLMTLPQQGTAKFCAP